MAKKTILLIIASNGFQPIEYGVPRTTLEDEDIEVVTASDKKNAKGNAVSSDGSETKVDLLVEDVDVDDYNGIFIIGGPGAMQHLDNEITYRIIRNADKSLDKIYGAICVSTRILAKADVLEGRNVTGWDGDNQLEKILKDNGTNYIREGVVVDRNIVTATGPSKAQEFAHAILKALYPYESEEEIEEEGFEE